MIVRIVNPSASLGSLVVGNGTLSFSGGETVNVTGVTDVGDNLNSGFTATSGTITGVINVTPGRDPEFQHARRRKHQRRHCRRDRHRQSDGRRRVPRAATGESPGQVRHAARPVRERHGHLQPFVRHPQHRRHRASRHRHRRQRHLQPDRRGTAVTAFGIDVNTRSSGNGTGTFSLSSGLFQVGGGGITADGGTANTFVGGATLQFTANAGIATPVTLTSGMILDTQTFTVSDTSTITGSGPITKNGTGILSLNGNNTYTGGTSVTGGKVLAFSNSALGTGTVTLTNGATLGTSGFSPGVFEGAVPGFNNFTTANPDSTIQQSAVQADEFVLPVTTTYVYTGQIFIPDATAAFAAAIDDGSWLSIDGNVLFSTPNNIDIGSGVVNIGMGPAGDGWHTFELRVSNNGGPGGGNGAGGFTQAYGFGYSFPDIASFGGSANAWTNVLGGSINGGDYVLPINSNPAVASVYRVAGATNIANNIVLGAGGGDIEVDGTNPVTFSGTISGAGTMTKSGSAPAVLTATNTYTGGTTISAGSLIVNGCAQQLVDGLDRRHRRNLGGTGTVGPVNSVTGAVNPGSTGSPGTLNVSTLTLGPGSLVLDLSNTAADSVTASSNVDITGATLSLNVGTVTPGETFTILTVPWRPAAD